MIAGSVQRVFRAHPILAVSFGLVAAFLLGVAIAIPTIRHYEIEHLAQEARLSSETLVAAMSNSAIFTGQPDSALSDLKEKAQALSRIHDEVVLYKVYFAKNAAVAALEYTEYTARIGTKLTQIAEAEQHARSSMETYDRDVEILKASTLATRAAAQDDLNTVSIDARGSTELAYQECALLLTLVQQFGIIRTRSQSALSDLGPDVQPSVAALRPTLEAELGAAHARRKLFNPAARGPG
ncbi:MAG: hypothetical protein ABSF50_21190 [Burkholderiaceae bacterium]|jgi:hypothetical protein